MFVYDRMFRGTNMFLSWFQVSVVADSVNVSGQSNAVQFKVPECRLSEDFNTLFDNQKFSDVTLSVQGREFQVCALKYLTKENGCFHNNSWRLPYWTS